MTINITIDSFKSVSLTKDNDILLTLPDGNNIILKNKTANAVEKIAKTAGYRQEVVDRFENSDIYRKDILRDDELIDEITEAYENRYANACDPRLADWACLDETIEEYEDELKYYLRKKKKN